MARKALRLRGRLNKTELEDQFEWTWKVCAGGKAPKREFPFSAPRRFRFDFAWPEEKVAVEIDGGVWSGGRHLRPTGFIRDCEKMNLATLSGWAVLRYTTEDIKQRVVEVVEEVRALLELRRAA